jgi:hypothetical protein
MVLQHQQRQQQRCWEHGDQQWDQQGQQQVVEGASRLLGRAGKQLNKRWGHVPGLDCISCLACLVWFTVSESLVCRSLA